MSDEEHHFEFGTISKNGYCKDRKGKSNLENRMDRLEITEKNSENRMGRLEIAEKNSENSIGRLEIAEKNSENRMGSLELKEISHPWFAQTTDPSDRHDVCVRRTENMSPSDWIAAQAEKLQSDWMKKNSENRMGSQSRDENKDNISSDEEMDEEQSQKYYFVSGNNNGDNIFMNWGENMPLSDWMVEKAEKLRAEFGEFRELGDYRENGMSRLEITEKNSENRMSRLEITEKNSENRTGSQSGDENKDNISSDEEMDEEQSHKYYFVSGNNNDDNIFMNWGEFETEMIMKQFRLEQTSSNPWFAQRTDPSDDYDAYVRRLENMSRRELVAEMDEKLRAYVRETLGILRN